MEGAAPGLTGEALVALGERIDQMVTIDAAARGVIGTLNKLSREVQTGPTCLKAAQLLLERVGPGDIVLIATGWPDRPEIDPEIAETDGPPGAVALARALHRGLRAVPVVLVEPALVGPMKAVLQAGDFRIMSSEQAVKAVGSRAKIHGACVLPMPLDADEAKRQARALVAELAPKAVVAVEKGGLNEAGRIHTSRGDDTTDTMAQADHLFRAAQAAGIATIGIGDGGNELGMGVIAEGIREELPWGRVARSGRGGIAPVFVTDVLVAAAISNWGAYGISAALAACLGAPEVFHTPEVEDRVLRVSGDAGFIDGISGWVCPGADGLEARFHSAFVALLGETVRQALMRAATAPKP